MAYQFEDCRGQGLVGLAAEDDDPDRWVIFLLFASFEIDVCHIFGVCFEFAERQQDLYEGFDFQHKEFAARASSLATLK